MQVAFDSGELLLLGESSSIPGASSCLINGIVQPDIAFKFTSSRIHRLELIVGIDTGATAVNATSPYGSHFGILHANVSNCLHHRKIISPFGRSNQRQPRGLGNVVQTPVVQRSTARFQRRLPCFDISTYTAYQTSLLLEQSFQLDVLTRPSKGSNHILGTFKHMQLNHKANVLLGDEELKASCMGDVSLFSLGKEFLSGEFQLKAKLEIAIAPHPKKLQCTRQQDIDYTLVWLAGLKTPKAEPGKNAPGAHTILNIGLGDLQQRFSQEKTTIARAQQNFAQLFSPLQIIAGFCRPYEISNLQLLAPSHGSGQMSPPINRFPGSGMFSTALRSLANECSVIQGSIILNAGFSTQQMGIAASKDNALFGIEISGSVQLAPRLLPSICDPITQSSQVSSIDQTSWLVTGGTGALGCLASDWLSLQGLLRQLKILGRSGKLSVESAAVLDQGHLVEIER